MSCSLCCVLVVLCMRTLRVFRRVRRLFARIRSGSRIRVRRIRRITISNTSCRRGIDSSSNVRRVRDRVLRGSCVVRMVRIRSSRVRRRASIRLSITIRSVLRLTVSRRLRCYA